MYSVLLSGLLEISRMLTPSSLPVTQYLSKALGKEAENSSVRAPAGEGPTARGTATGHLPALQSIPPPKRKRS